MAPKMAERILKFEGFKYFFEEAFGGFLFGKLA
jgi:hypothetical protein